MKACNGKSELGDGCVMLFVFEWYVGSFLLVVDFTEQTYCYRSRRPSPETQSCARRRPPSGSRGTNDVDVASGPFGLLAVAHVVLGLFIVSPDVILRLSCT